MTEPSLFESKFMKNEQDLHKHVVYVVKRSFYGYDPKDNVLKEYSREQVKEVVSHTFNGNVFLEDVITQDTTLLIVPDDWDRVLPLTAKQYVDNLVYLPFSYILHPLVTSPNKMALLRAPPDAAYRILMREQKRVMSPDSFVLKEVAQDDIMQRFQGWLYASSKKMAPMHARTHTMHAKKTHHPKKKVSLQRKSSAMIKTMDAEEEEDEEYQTAWKKLLARTTAEDESENEDE